MLGNITQKSGQGTYIYEAPTDRLTSVGANAYNYDDNGNVLSDGERTLTWTAQNKVRSLNRNGDAWSLLYDADGTRVGREEAAANEATYNVSPTYELRFEGSSLSQAKISVLGTTGRVVAEVVADRTELASNERWENTKSFVHDDHLGSTHAVTDREAAVQSRVMYGPWGRARDGDNWYFLLDEADLEDLPVGFTGHQPELDAGLINMRGRMYDPAVGRFMSVDPVIEDALEVGTWNAYSYVQNRPLSLVDPTGLASEEPIDDDGPSFHEPTGDDVADEFLRELRDILSKHGGTIFMASDGPEDEEKKGEEGETVEQHEESGKCASVDKRWCVIADAGSQIVQRSSGGKTAMVLVALASLAIVGAAVVGAGYAGREVTSEGISDLALDTTEDLVEELGIQDEAYIECFPAGTQVFTRRGPTAIEDIDVGESVWAFDSSLEEWGWFAVSQTHAHLERGGMVRVSMTSGGEIVSTSAHPYCVRAGEELWSRSCPSELDDCAAGCVEGARWVPAEELRRGDVLFAGVGDEVVVDSVEAVSSNVFVYNLTVERAQSYVVSSLRVLVHNVGGSRGLPELPAVDNTGKVHGQLPNVQQLKLYTSDELEVFQEQLQRSVRRRIEVTNQLGGDPGHGARQEAEQRAIRHITKILGDR